jgi:hypothetical protein
MTGLMENLVLWQFWQVVINLKNGLPGFLHVDIEENSNMH